MSTDRDLNRIVRSWMDEGVTALPDHVLDAVLDQLAATPQRRSSWTARRTPIMNSTTRLVAAAAAVVVVALIGYQLLIEPNAGGPPPTEAPSPSASSASIPSTTASPALPIGALEPGTYRMPMDLGGAPFRFTVREGWHSDSNTFVQRNTDSDSFLEMTTGVMLSAWQVDHVFADSCVGEGTEQPIDEPSDRSGAADEVLAAALADQTGGQTAAPVTTRLDDHPALLVELIAPTDLGRCGGRLRIWPGLGGDLNSGWVEGPGQTDKVYVVDADNPVPGRPWRLVIVATHWADTSSEDLAELEAVLASILIP